MVRRAASGLLLGRTCRPDVSAPSLGVQPPLAPRSLTGSLRPCRLGLRFAQCPFHSLPLPTLCPAPALAAPPSLRPRLPLCSPAAPLSPNFSKTFPEVSLPEHSQLPTGVVLLPGPPCARVIISPNDTVLATHPKPSARIFHGRVCVFTAQGPAGLDVGRPCPVCALDTPARRLEESRPVSGTELADPIL